MLLLLPCAYKSMFDISCPLCGAQRSILLLAQGEVTASFIMCPPIYFLLLTAVIVLCTKALHISISKPTVCFLLAINISVLIFNCVLKNLGYT